MTMTWRIVPEATRKTAVISTCRVDRPRGRRLQSHVSAGAADVLYAFIRTHKPDRIIQVGCGVSTAVILAAATDAAYRPHILCIDPFPTRFLTEQAAAGAIALAREPMQLVEIDRLTGLAAGDFFFVDSTHTVKPGSEVNRIVLEVLPRLAGGVLVHFHDIHFPYDYDRGVLTSDLMFSSESVLLHAYLIGNSGMTILASLSMLHYAATDTVKTLIPRYDPQGNDNGMRSGEGSHFPSSIYLRCTQVEQPWV